MSRAIANQNFSIWSGSISFHHNLSDFSLLTEQRLCVLRDTFVYQMFLSWRLFCTYYILFPQSGLMHHRTSRNDDSGDTNSSASNTQKNNIPFCTNTNSVKSMYDLKMYLDQVSVNN